jgi:hypothetical protein
MKTSHFISSSLGNVLCQSPSVIVSASVTCTHTHTHTHTHRQNVETYKNARLDCVAEDLHFLKCVAVLLGK